MRASTILTTAALLWCTVSVSTLAQQPTPPPQQEDNSKKQEKKVWTNDDLKRLPDSVNVAGQPAASNNSTHENGATSQSQNAENPNNASQQQPYDQARDATRYQKQLAPLRQELEQIDQRLNAIRQAQKNGAGASNAISLTNVPAGVDTQGELEVLQKRHAQVAADIDDLETEARRNGIPLGDLLKEPPPEPSGTQASAGTEQQENEGVQSPEVIKAKKAIAEEQNHLDFATKELDLLQRELNLDQQTVYSNPNYSTTGAGNSTLDEKRSQIGDKQAEIDQTEQKLQELRERLRDLELNPPARAENAQQTASSAEPAAKAEQENGEAYWRKGFADLRAKIHLAETERDVLQRELNVLQLQYDQNPQKAMTEQNTRESINGHTDELAAKDKEIADLKQQLVDLEDELRRAGGEPGWARE